MEEVKLNILLTGKTGHGKSATGNTILNRRVFESSSSAKSKTADVDFSFQQYEKYLLQVVDGPGLVDTNKSEAEDKIAAAENMNKALAMCYGGVDAFLFVTRFGNRSTGEEKSVLDSLKKIFGNGFIEQVIVVMTCGDQFQGAMEDENRKISFHDWCGEEENGLVQLYKDCRGRFVLFNNRETDETKKLAQIKQILELAHGLKDSKGRYTSQCFQDAEAGRNRMIFEQRAPHLKLEIQIKAGLLVADIQKLSKNPSDRERERISKRVQDLRSELELQDTTNEVIIELLGTVKGVEDNLNDVVALHRLAKSLEGTRKAKTAWGMIGTALTVVAGGVAVVAAAPVAIAAAGLAALGSAGATVVGCQLFHSAEKEKEKQSDIVKIKIDKFNTKEN